MIKKIDGKLKNKKLRMFLPIIVLSTVVILFVFVGVLFVKPNSSLKKPDVAISNELTKDKKFLDLTISDIEIEEGEYLTHLMANIYNHGDTFQDRMVDIIFLDQDGKELGRAPTYISSIEQNGAIRIDTVIDKKLAKAYTFKVEG